MCFNLFLFYCYTLVKLCFLSAMPWFEKQIVKIQLFVIIMKIISFCEVNVYFNHGFVTHSIKQYHIHCENWIILLIKLHDGWSYMYLRLNDDLPSWWVGL